MISNSQIRWVGHGQHLAGVRRAVSVLLTELAHDPDGLARRVRPLHGDEGQHRDVELGRGRGVFHLLLAAYRRLADGDLLVVYVAEVSVDVA